MTKARRMTDKERENMVSYAKEASNESLLKSFAYYVARAEKDMFDYEACEIRDIFKKELLRRLG